jgi:hypothetical protein
MKLRRKKMLTGNWYLKTDIEIPPLKKEALL